MNPALPRFVAPALAAFVMAAMTPRTAAASLRMESVTTWAENIARASSPSNWLDTLRQEARVGASHLHPLATGLSVVVDAEAGFETVPRYERNTAYVAGASATLRKKFGLGAFAPVAAVEVGLRRNESRLAGDDHWAATGALRLSQRFTDSWRAALTADWRQHYAAHSTFDVRHHRVIGTVAWDIDDLWQLSYGRGALWGDFVANAGWPIWQRALAGQITPTIAQYYNTVSWEITDAYGPRWVTYRVTGRSDFWWLELSPALGRNTSLPLRFETSYTVNVIGIAYRQTLWTLGLVHRF